MENVEASGRVMNAGTCQLPASKRMQIWNPENVATKTTGYWRYRVLQGVQFYSFFLSLLLCFVVFLLVDCPSFHYYNPPKLRHQTLAATLGQQNGHQQQEGKSEPLSRKRIRHAEKHLAPPPKIKPKINNKKNPKQATTKHRLPFSEKK